MPKYLVWAALGSVVVLALVIWGIASFFAGGPETADGRPFSSTGKSRRTMTCHLSQPMTFVDKHVCIYECENGEKSRVEGVERCLKVIEVNL